VSVLDALRTYFPKLNSFADDEVLAAIERSGYYVGTEQWGGSKRADYARALLVAHFLTAPDGPPVKARSGGGISETYAVKEGDSWLSSTAYGAEFLELKRRTVPQRFRIAPLPYAIAGPWRGGRGGGWY
jgi:hypothetical protein